jgi:hypothetical protein
MTDLTEQWARREDVREMGKAIQEQIDRRFIEQRDRGDERHADNLDRFDAILAEQRRTNGRVTTLEALFKELKDEFTGIRRRWHDFRDSIVKSIKADGGIGTGENRKLVVRDFLLVSGTIVACYAFAKAFRWVP